MKKQKINLFIFLFILSFFLLSCHNESELSQIPQYPNAQLSNCQMIDMSFAPSPEGIYYNNDVDLLFLPKGGNTFLFLSHLFYQDDQAVAMGKTGYPKSYVEMPAGKSTYYINGFLYYIGDYTDVEGNSRYTLNHLDKAGRNRKTLLSFTYQPSDYLISQGHILITEFAQDNQTKMHLFDSQLRETVVTVPGDADHLFTTDHSFRYTTCEFRNNIHYEKLYELDFDGNYTLLDEVNGNIFVASDKYYIVDYFIDHKDSQTYSAILDYQGNVLQKKTDERIVYIDENYFYTEAKGPKQAYSRYFLDGRLDRRIVPSEILGQVGESIWTEHSDYDAIEKLFGDHFLVRQLDRKRGFEILILGSFEDGSLQILDTSRAEESFSTSSPKTSE